jgi:hypothetical protein
MTDPIKLAIEALEKSQDLFPSIGRNRLALAALRSIKPDCRGCNGIYQYQEDDVQYCARPCTNGDKFQALAPVYLYRRT